MTACAPTIPDSGAGVGFDDYNAYERQRQQREVALRGGGTVPLDTGRPVNTPDPAPRVISDEDLRAAGLPIGTPSATTPPPSTATSDGFPAPAPVTGAPISAITPAQPVSQTPVNNPGISDEQDFSAVAERETIESDRERIEQNREAYRVIQPTAVPSRPNAGEPNIVAFALSTTNNVGQQIYSRSSFNKDAKFQRACAGYASPDRAQEDFLKNGGPQRDRLGVDPDGDGFACYWDPSPFRAVARN